MSESRTAKTVAAPASDPMVVEVTRGSAVESRHSVSYAVVDLDGKVPRYAGDPELLLYPRSAIKAIQALPLLETGAAEANALGDKELALACASHNGETVHTEAVDAWLSQIGLSADALECGVQLPYDEASTTALLLSGQRPSALHNNCSGKHSGFLTLARHLKLEGKGYIRRDHGVQQHVLGALESMTGLDLGHAPCGIDGCGIPTFALPLGNLALAMARFGQPLDQPEARQAACAKLREAVSKEPYMVGGRNVIGSDVMRLTGTRLFVKNGAEGVICASLPELGLGIAVKAHDGAGRAADLVMGQLLVALDLLDENARAALAKHLRPAITNRAGLTVGGLRLASSLR